MVHAVAAKDITDETVLAIVHAAIAERGYATPYDVIAALPRYPPKVVRAKVRKVILKGLAEGCSDPGCTCASFIDPT